MWIASDRHNKLMLFDCDEKPRRVCNVSWACDNHRGVGYLTNTDIDISWKDEPKKVSIVLDENIEKMLDYLDECLMKMESNSDIPVIDRETMKSILLKGMPEVKEKPLYSVGDNVFVNEFGESLSGRIVGVDVENGRYVYSVELSLAVGDYPDVYIYEEKDITKA